jgi:hypothetical protein
MQPDEMRAQLVLARHQLVAKPAWQLPHPWQTAGAAAAAALIAKSQHAEQVAEPQHPQQQQRQQQQRLDAALLQWQACCLGSSRGGARVLAYDALARPNFGASFVERRWRHQLQLSDLQQVAPEVG